MLLYICFFFFSSRRRHTRLQGDWSSDVCSSDLSAPARPSCTPRALASDRALRVRALMAWSTGLSVVIWINLRSREERRPPRPPGEWRPRHRTGPGSAPCARPCQGPALRRRSEEHTSELQSPCNLVCRLLL